jgi:hypothetical protein
LSTDQPDIVIFSETLAYLTLRTQILTAIEFKYPKPVQPGNGEPGKEDSEHIPPLLLTIPNSSSLAKPFPYHQARKNCTYDLDILQGPLWENDFRCQGLKEADCRRKWQGVIRSKRVDMLWILKVFGSVISFGSGQ